MMTGDKCFTLASGAGVVVSSLSSEVEEVLLGADRDIKPSNLKGFRPEAGDHWLRGLESNIALFLLGPNCRSQSDSLDFVITCQ